jgi:hypothetical protein
LHLFCTIKFLHNTQCISVKLCNIITHILKIYILDTMNFALADLLVHVKLNPLNTFVIRPILHLDGVCFVLHLYLYCGTSFNWKGGFEPLKWVSPLHFILKYLYHARKLICRVVVC